MPIPDIERAVGAHHRARSRFQIHDVGPVRAPSFLEVDLCVGLNGLKPTQNPLADQFDRWRDPDVFVMIEDVALPHAVEEEVACERVGLR